ncbi:transmembrane protein 17-like [Wyeomyia smithii]|uniref:transmembrane protein 17-like n=1 Tax=Wyeomyia smithii TaxID=174621 RepID=UPI002467B376|nr:transmembrane protein 17-like [Wyeomyia smithii]
MNDSSEEKFSSVIIVNRNSNNQNTKSVFNEERYFASVWVQLLLQFNIYFSGIWFVSSLITMYKKYCDLSTITRVLSIISLVIAAPVECIRLFLGYSGNLLDKIPDFAGYWILSVFIQTPLQLYMMSNEAILKYVISTVIQAVQCVLLFLQIVSSFAAIRRASFFHREQFQSTKTHR